MSSEQDEFRKGMVAAVQAELERHASAVVAEVDRLREETRRERAEMRTELTSQMNSLAGAIEQVQTRAELNADVISQMNSLAESIEQVQTRAEANHERLRDAIETRLTESEARQTRRVDDATAGLDGMVTAAMRPVMQDLRDENEALAHRVEGLDSNLRKFDEQAARMVTYFNEVSTSMEARQDEMSDALKADVLAELDVVKNLVEENDSSVRRFQNEVGQSVSQRVGDAEDRFNNRLLAAESRMKEEAGQKIAEIDVHVSRVSTNLDETMAVLNDRISGIDDKFVTTDRRLEEFAKSIAGIDQDALEELKDKMSTAAGEAMLVRIEMERLEKNVNERNDGLTVRMTEVETQLADATMDVSTAVQLDRLEEIERALLELDPAKFVLKNDASGADGSSGGTKNDNNDMNHEYDMNDDKAKSGAD